jgi:transcriptional regulator with XRE-family HTH domain
MQAVNQLKKFRVRAELTQTEVARRIGVAQPTYQRWEAGSQKIPEAKLRELSLLFNAPSDVLSGSHAPIDIAIYDSSAPESLSYFGEVAFHFSGGGAPLLLHISVGEMRALWSTLQGGSYFVVVDSLSNQRVAIRRSALADVHLSSEACDEYGPEHDDYEVPPIMMPDPRDWEIVEALEFNEVDRFDPQAVARVTKKILSPWTDPVDDLLSRGALSDRKVDEETQRRAWKAVFDLAKNCTYQLSNGRIRRFRAERGDFLHRSFYGIFELDGMGGTDADIFVTEEIEDRMIHIRSEAMDYITVPLHKWEASEIEAEDQTLE